MTGEQEARRSPCEEDRRTRPVLHGDGPGPEIAADGADVLEDRGGIVVLGRREDDEVAKPASGVHGVPQVVEGQRVRVVACGGARTA